MEEFPHERINIDPDEVGHGFAKLVLIVIELLHKLVEKQAMRRMEGGSLLEEEIEQLGLTLMKLEAQVEEMKHIFGLEHEDLNINLGPLGKLM